MSKIERALLPRRARVAWHRSSSSRGQWSVHDDDLVFLDAVTENRMGVGITAFGVHQHGLTKSPADRLEERAEDIEPILTLYFTEVDVEADLRRVVEAEGREHLRSRPDAKGGGLGVRRATEHRFCTG
jgi:hypothetical protein